MHMQPVLIPATEKTAYDRLVAGAASGSFLQSWDWGEWQRALGRPVARYFLQTEKEKLAGAIQLVRMPLPLGRHYWYAPYGPVADREHLSAFVAEIKNRYPEALFVRVEPKTALGAEPEDWAWLKTKNVQPGKTLVLDLNHTEAELLAHMHPKTRYNIRLALKHGVEVQKDLAIIPGHGLYYKEAVGLIVETAKRQGYRGHGQKYYENLVDFFARKNPPAQSVCLSIYKALYQNRLLASAIMLDFGPTRTYLFGGSAEEDKQVMAPYALHWQAILDAKTKGLKAYDFWGLETAAGRAAGFARFKSGFGGQAVEYAGAYDLPVLKSGYRLYKLARRFAGLLGR